MIPPATLAVAPAPAWKLPWPVSFLRLNSFNKSGRYKRYPTGPNSSKALNFWNGTSWSADTDDAPYKARGSSGGGSATDGIICAGISDPNFTLTTTIEWNVDAAVGTISTS